MPHFVRGYKCVRSFPGEKSVVPAQGPLPGEAQTAAKLLCGKRRAKGGIRRQIKAKAAIPRLAACGARPIRSIVSVRLRIIAGAGIKFDR
jgi:hypothetical protein